MQASKYDPRYLRFFECFNRRLYFEAHEVLEGLWLPQRQGPHGPFYKGPIQLAGAFVHLQKNRPGPAVRLLELAQGNLQRFPASYDGLAVGAVLALIDDWRHRLSDAAPTRVPFTPSVAGQPRLQPPGQ